MIWCDVVVVNPNKLCVYVYPKQFHYADKKDLKELPYKADRVYVSDSCKYVELQYELEDKSDDEIFEYLEHDMQLIKDYFAKYDRINRLVNAIKDKFNIEEPSICPLTRQPCLRGKCMHYNRAYDKCELFFVDVYCG